MSMSTAIGNLGARSGRGARRLTAPLALLALIGAATPAWAQGNEKFDVSVWAIRATKGDTEIDPELRSIARQLQAQFKVTGFKVVAKRNGTVGEGETFSADLTGRFKARLTPLKRDGKRVQMKVEIVEREGREEKQRLGTTVTIDSGRFNLQGGWKLGGKGDDILIVATSGK